MYVCRLQNGHRPERIKKVSEFKEGPEEQDKGLTHIHEVPRSLGKAEDIGELPGGWPEAHRAVLQCEPSCRSMGLVWIGQKG